MKRPSSAIWGGPFVSYEVQAAAPTPPLPRGHTAHPSPKKFLSRIRGRGEHPRERAAVTCGRLPYSSCPLSLFLSSLPKSPSMEVEEKLQACNFSEPGQEIKVFRREKEKISPKKGLSFQLISNSKPGNIPHLTRQDSFPPSSAMDLGGYNIKGKSPYFLYLCSRCNTRIKAYCRE